MKFGIFLPLQSPRPWGPASDHRLIGEALEQAELADRLGYDCVWTQEHHFLEEYSHASAPEVLLAAISQRTQQIRLGHGVMLTAPVYNHPVRCAERIAMLDQISGGRVEWGTGCSGTPVELEAFGIEAGEKHAMWEEGLRAALRLLSEQPFSGLDGRYVRIPQRNLVPKAFQTPHPPLWLACSTRASLRIAARFGMGALTFAFVDADEARHWVAEYYAEFEAACHPIGRVVNPNIAMLSNFACHEDAERARALGLTGAEFFAYGLGHYFRGAEHASAGTDLWRAFVESGERPFVNPRCFDTPDALAAHFRSFEEAGVDQIILLQQAGGYDHAAVCASLESFAATALPEFKLRDSVHQIQKHERLAAAIERAQSPGGSRPMTVCAPAPRADGDDVQPQPAAASVPATLADCRNLPEVLAYRANERPLHRALCELNAQGEIVRAYGYAELARAVEQQARKLARRLAPGDCVVVLGDSGASLMIALLAASRAGGVPVPCARPQPDRGIERVLSIVRRVEPRVIIGARAALATLPDGGAVRLSFEELAEPAEVAAGPWLHPIAELALLQFTSGSLQTPKGVPISHDMLLASLANTQELFGFSSADRFLAMLPLHHTLGLMVHALSALHCGAVCFTLEPLDFAVDPALWLRAISRHAITVSGAPNFAYARCAQLTAAGLDLSSWRLAINGGEPPRAATLDRFCERWRESGFARTAFAPSYGMTEATGTVSGRLAGTGPRELRIPAAGLQRARTSVADEDGVFISNGRTGAATRIAVVDPGTRERLAEGEIGEIWLSGPSIATHYFGQDASSEEFGELAGEPERRYLRTGDLGTLVDGELCLLGRHKELIIVRGENVLPEEVEMVAQHACPAIGPSGAIALGVDREGTESLALLVELPAAEPDPRACAQAIQSAVAQRLGVRVARLCCLAEGALPKTPIGKRKRSEARRMLLARELTLRFELSDHGEAAGPSLERELEELWERILQRSRPARTETFFQLGGDSLQAAGMLAEANARWNCDVTLSEIVSRLTIETLASRLRAGRHAVTARPAETTLLAAFAGYEARILNGRDAPAAVSCLTGAFQRLPLVRALEPSTDEITAFMSAVVDSAAQRGLSIALYRDGKLIGCGICEDYAELLRSEPPALPRRLAAGVAIQAELDCRYIASAGLPSEPTLHMNLLALERAYEGRELPARLTELTLDLAVMRGYRAAIVHAASPVVQELLREQFGFSCVGSQVYSTYEHEGVRPFADLAEPQAIQLLTRSLRNWKSAAATARQVCSCEKRRDAPPSSNHRGAADRGG